MAANQSHESIRALVREISKFVENYDHGNDPYCCSNSLYWCSQKILEAFGLPDEAAKP